MNPKNAIEILTEDIHHPTAKFTPELVEAEKLGIEALKRFIAMREDPYCRGFWPLLGETEEFCKFCGIAHTGIECPDRGGEK
ncbi:hypothetical protein ES703_66534 [subsurface metagenome]